MQKSLRRDFFLSFMHSQGNSKLQCMLYDRLAEFHVPRFTATDHDRLRDDDFYYLVFSRLPRSHFGKTSNVKIEEAAVEHDASAQAEVFHQAILDYRQPSTAKRGAIYTYPDIAKEIIAKDIKFQSKKRLIGSDSHASYFRNHVVLGETTGSEAFDGVYQALRQSKTVDQPFNLATLACAWEINHPGEQFEPPEIV